MIQILTDLFSSGAFNGFFEVLRRIISWED